MPNYTFENTKTGENFIEFMAISEKEKFLADNPHLKFVFTPIYIEGKAANRNLLVILLNVWAR